MDTVRVFVVCVLVCVFVFVRLFVSVCQWRIQGAYLKINQQPLQYNITLWVWKYYFATNSNQNKWAWLKVGVVVQKLSCSSCADHKNLPPFITRSDTACVCVHACACVCAEIPVFLPFP